MNIIPSDVDLDQFMAYQEGQYLRPASDFIDDAIALLAGDEEILGDTLPWSKCDPLLRCRMSEVTLWASPNGHGKSLLVGQIMTWMMMHSRVMIASMEMKPAMTALRMCCQAAGSEHPTESWAREWFAQSDDRLWIYDQMETIAPERMCALVRYAAQELGCRHVVIDSLMKSVKGTDDYSGQKDFVDRLCQIAKAEGIHVHLIHHVRKGSSEADIPGKYDVKGAGEIVDLVDNCVLIHRNIRKQEMVARGDVIEEPHKMPDTRLIVVKQRNGGFEGRIGLWYRSFDRLGGTYVQRHDDPPMYLAIQ